MQKTAWLPLRLGVLALSVATLVSAAFVCLPTLRADDVDPLAPPPVLRPVPEKYSDANRLWQGIASLEVDRSGGVWVS